MTKIICIKETPKDFSRKTIENHVSVIAYLVDARQGEVLQKIGDEQRYSQDTIVKMHKQRILIDSLTPMTTHAFYIDNHIKMRTYVSRESK